LPKYQEMLTDGILLYKTLNDNCMGIQIYIDHEIITDEVLTTNPALVLSEISHMYQLITQSSDLRGFDTLRCFKWVSQFDFVQTVKASRNSVKFRITKRQGSCFEQELRCELIVPFVYLYIIT
jgi:hypothetical protein